MQHNFDVDIAAQYDMSVAVFLNNLAFWIHHNSANKINLHDGMYWTFNSRDAFTVVFPYWNADQIKRIINKCKEAGLILTGNYNKKNYDKTNWYTLTKKGMGLFSSYFKHLTVDVSRLGENAQGPLGENAQPIPDIKQTIYKTTTREAPTSEDKPNAPQEPVVVLSDKAKAAGIGDRDIKKWTGSYSEEKVARAMEIFERTAIVKNPHAFIAKCLKDDNWEMPKTNTEGGYVNRDTNYIPKLDYEESKRHAASMDDSALIAYIHSRVMQSFKYLDEEAKQHQVDLKDAKSIRGCEVLMNRVVGYIQEDGGLSKFR